MIKINFFNDYNSKLSCNTKELINIAKVVLQDSKHYSAKVSVILSNQKKLNKLKNDFFNIDHYTDVITFNLEDNGEPIDGEIYISIDDVLKNAKKFDQTFNEEFKRIFVHGFLHLAGYNDSTDNEKQIMTNLEDKYILIEKGEVIQYDG